MDDNSVFNPSYQSINTKMGYRKQVFAAFEIDLEFGINNLSNEQFSSHVALNARAFGDGGPAFFNPSPDRNLFAGASIKYLFNKTGS